MAILFQPLLTVALALRPTSWTLVGVMLSLVSGKSPNLSLTSVNHPSVQANIGVHQRKRAYHDDDGTQDRNKNPKRRQSSKHYPDRSYCLPCAIWNQSGGDTHLQQFHPIDNSRHAGSEALSLSLYASFDNIIFDLGNNDCVCEPCYRDYTRNKHNRENIIPR